MSPVGSALQRTRLTPDHLTALGLLMAVPTAVAIGSGHLLLGLLLLVTSAVPDLLDGALAKASGTSSVRGAFFDSVSDRVTDALVLGGIAWYLQGRHHGKAFMLPFAILGLSLLISYERAKAESLGLSAKGGLMERAERVIVLCVGLAFGFLLVPLLWVMLVLTSITAVQRFVKVWRQASKPPAEPPGAMAQRWRAWREASGWGSGPLLGTRFAQGSRPAPGTRTERRRARMSRRAGAEGSGGARVRRDNRRP